MKTEWSPFWKRCTYAPSDCQWPTIELFWITKTYRNSGQVLTKSFSHVLFPAENAVPTSLPLTSSSSLGAQLVWYFWRPTVCSPPPLHGRVSVSCLIGGVMSAFLDKHRLQKSRINICPNHHWPARLKVVLQRRVKTQGLWVSITANI